MAQSSRTGGSGSPESYDSLARRAEAAAILQSYEKLSWHSVHRCESLQQTRLHFQNIVAGFTAEDEAQFVDWKDDVSPHPLKPGEEPKAGRKGKERASTGAVGDVSAGTSSPRNRPSGGAGTAASSSASAKKKRKSGGRH